MFETSVVILAVIFRPGMDAVWSLALKLNGLLLVSWKYFCQMIGRSAFLVEPRNNWRKYRLTHSLLMRKCHEVLLNFKKVSV